MNFSNIVCLFFQCEYCQKAFNQKNSLDLHLRRHTGSKPYKCEFCQMTFTQNGNLRSHIKRVHSIETDEPLLRCDECSCTFKKVRKYTIPTKITKVELGTAMKVRKGTLTEYLTTYEMVRC